jgi:DNA-binding NarL/FixJ family response regulator
MVVDDYEPWRRFLRSTLQKQPEYQVIGEVSDGLEAVRQAEQLQPDLVLLDIGLPTLNGIEAARRIKDASPSSRILFVSENHSLDVITEALSVGGRGYVVKSDAASELLPALEAVFEGRQFVSAILADALREHVVDDRLGKKEAKVSFVPAEFKGRSCHQVEFYPDDESLVDGFARFIETALESGSAVTFIATGSHRVSVLKRLKVHAVDVDTLIEQGRYASLDVTEALSTVMGSNGLPDPVRCATVLGDLITDSARSGHRRVSACGEFAPVLLKDGKIEAAIQMEHLTDEFARNHDIDIFCGYLSDVLPPDEGGAILERIRLEHSAVRG